LHKLSKKKIKIGILGGTFDPPHIGHLHISKVGIKKLKLNKLMWLITEKNPLKQKPSLSIKKRIKLSEKITSSERKIFVQYLESKIKSKNTFDLLNYIRCKNKKVKIFFLMGADNFVRFHKWKNWKKIPNLAKLVIFARKNYSVKALNSIASKKLMKKAWIYIPGKKVNISSSLIRKF
tara:strand:+ start:4309 stop:4842 length:534 start_codon:yes stop_codon:yes gene_type:complete